MKGKISAFYGARMIDEAGNEIATFPNGTEVEILDTGGNVTGEYTKVTNGKITGWVRAECVSAPLYHPE